MTMSSTSFTLIFNWNFTNQNNSMSYTTISAINKTSKSEASFNISTSSDCYQLQFKEFIPWNNPDNIVSFEVEDTIRQVTAGLFLPLLFLIGFPANVINMVVFYKQGLKERVNVCLFALSLADGVYLAFIMVLYGEQLRLIFASKETYGPVFTFITNNNLMGFFASAVISQVLSAIIASDRCFCILRPLRSQNLLKTSTVTAIISGVYIFLLCAFFVAYARYRVACAYDPLRGITLMTILSSDFYLRHQQLVDFLEAFICGGALSGFVITVVVVTTITTAAKLRQAAAWRAEASSRTGDLTQRDIALTKMLVSNSAFFIACVLPICGFRSDMTGLAFLAFPEVNPYRRHHNFYFTIMWLFSFLLGINCTFNFVVYYSMGSRYRQTFWSLFGRKSKT